MTKRPATKDTVTGRACANEGGLTGVGPEVLLHEGPALVAYVVLPLEDTSPTQGPQQALGPLVIRPEFGHMPAGLSRTPFEGRQQPVGVAFVPLLRQDHHVDQMGHPTSEPVAQAPDPVPDLVAENEVMVI